MMSRLALNTLLFIALAVTVGLNWLTGHDVTRPGFEFLPEMVYSVPADAYSASTIFADGKTLQRPVEGTIARGALPFAFAATPEDAVRAGRELPNPFAEVEPGARDRGAAVFASFCQHCHGAKGLGDGPVARRGFPPPPSLLAEKALTMPDGQMFHALTYGQGNMPSHAAQLDPADRWHAITYVRSLQERGLREAAAALTDTTGADQP